METFLIVMLAAICTALPFWIGQRYGLVALMSPMHLLSYFCLFGFLVKVTVYGASPQRAFYRNFVDTPWADQRGAIYLGMFILLMCLGYRCAVRPQMPCLYAARKTAAGPVRGGWLFTAAFVVAGLTILLLLRARGLQELSWDALTDINSAKQINVNADGVGATLAGLKTLFIVPKFAFVLLLAQGLVLQNRWILAQSLVLGGLLVVIALVSGDRFELVELIVFAVATHLIVDGRFGPRTSACVILCVAGVIVTSAYMTHLRGSDTGLVGQIVSSTYFLDINVAVMVTDQVTPQMYLWGESYGWWTFGWVPRAIWVDKPAIDLGVFLKRDVMQIMTGGAFNITGPGEAFMNFGWAGAGVGFALGWIYRKGEAALLSARNCLQFGAFLFYPMLFYPFIQATLQSSFSAFIVGAVAQSLLIFAMIAVFVPRYRVVHPSHPKQRGLAYAA